MDTNYTLGMREGSGEPVVLTPEERRRNIEIIGKTGTGKSTLLHNLMSADFASGRGFAFIDPHGDQAAAIADATPKHRINDVIYLDAADLSYSIGWNPLERVEPDRRAVVAAQIAQAFAGIWGLSTAETPRLLYVLDKALRLLLDNPADPQVGHEPGATLLGLPRLLIDDDYRDRLLRRCQDRTVRDFWQSEFAAYNPRFRQEAIAPIQNKVGQLVGNPFIRAIIGQPKSTISIRRIMDGGKILIVNLSKGGVFVVRIEAVEALLAAADGRVDNSGRIRSLATALDDATTRYGYARVAVAYSMVWHDRGPDPMADPAAAAVLEAFDAAQAARLPHVICYRAGIEAWRRVHPHQRPEYAAKQAVDVILAAKVRLRVADA
jgi:hypothetical protein